MKVNRVNWANLLPCRSKSVESTGPICSRVDKSQSTQQDQFRKFVPKCNWQDWQQSNQSINQSINQQSKMAQKLNHIIRYKRAWLTRSPKWASLWGTRSFLRHHIQATTQWLWEDSFFSNKAARSWSECPDLTPSWRGVCAQNRQLKPWKLRSKTGKNEQYTIYLMLTKSEV
jgi:hypothetical protein